MPDYKKLIRRKVTSRRISPEIKGANKLFRKAGTLLLFAVLICGIVLAARPLLINIADFKIKQVTVINQNGKPLANPEDFFCLDSDHDFRIFSFDLERAAQDIRARHPELKDVFIRKQFPGRLLIVVQEREAVALIALKDFYLVDEEGFIMPYQSAQADLPKILGIHPRHIQAFTQTRSLRVKRALNLLQELKRTEICSQYRISQIDVREYSDVVFYLDDRIEIKMGQSEFGRKAGVLSKILVQLKESDTFPKYIDMRFDHPVIKP